MEKAIRILYVEDIPSDAELVLREISRSGFSFTHTIVETKKDYTEALISYIPDLIISDYSLPQFDGMNALSLRNEMVPQTPFILVTGSVNEEVAVECIKAGADDYILKTNLKRLPYSIKAAFAKRDKLLLNLHAESEFRNKIEQIKIAKPPAFKNDNEGIKTDGSGVKDNDLKEEKLTLLDMAIKSAGIGTWVFDISGDKRYFDKKACQLLGLPPGEYKRTEEEFLTCIHSDDRSEVKTLLSYSIRKKSDFETEFRVTWPDETVRFMTARAEIILNDAREPVRLNGLIWDITDQKLLLITLQENIRKTNSIINNLNGAVFRCKFDEEMTMEYISEGVKELSGYPLWDFLMNRVRSFASIIYIDDRERVIKTIKEAIYKKDPFTVEFRIVSSHGDIKWIWERGRGVFAADNIIAIEGFFNDITDRKKTEEELKTSLEQLHQLTQYIEKVRENERVAISRELHDDLGQALTAVKIDLGTIKQSVSDSEVILKINKVSSLVSETIKTVQRLTSQLRPPIIDDLGLKSAIEWYTSEFAERNKVEVSLEIDASIIITPGASLIIFRIMQEALTNIARHSKADRVYLKLSTTGDFIYFMIGDNGIGMTENEIKSKESFGIMSMKERAASMGGVLNIYRENNCETVIKLVFPLNNSGTDENFNM